MRVYRSLLRLYPKAHRDVFGIDMLEMFADQLKTARSTGPAALVRLWSRTLVDVAVNASLTRLPMYRLTTSPQAHTSGDALMLLRQNITLAFRSLRRNPLFALVAIVTIALGIGANSAIFSVVHGITLKALPYEAPDDLVFVWTTTPETPQLAVSEAEYLDYRAESAVLEDLGAYGVRTVTVTGGGPAERRTGAYATSSLFNVLGVSAAIGRTFSGDEDVPGGANVVVLSHGYWQTRFGAEGGLPEQPMIIDDVAFDVVGVLPAGFDPPEGSPDFYTPAPFDRSRITNRSGHDLVVVGRLGAGQSVASAQEELRAILPRWSERFAGVHANDLVAHPLVLAPLRDVVLGHVQPMFWILLGAVGLVLLLAAANVANLLLARGQSRSREMTVRAALGAGRRDLIQLMLTESLALATVGGVAGLSVGAALTSLVKRLDPGGIPRLGEVSVDWTVIAFTAVVTVGTGLLVGLLPALQSARGDASAALREGSRGGSASRQSKRALQGLVVAQMALAVLLLTGTGILVKNLVSLQSVDPGFSTDRRVGFKVQVMNQTYPTGISKLTFYDRLRESLTAVPGISGVALARALPLRSNVGTEGMRIEGRTLAPDERRPSVGFQVASDDYFSLMDIPVVQGRAIERTDVDGAPPVMLINEAAARAYFRDEDAVGQRARLTFFPDDWPLVTIVGVVGDVRQGGLRAAAQPEVYIPPGQLPANWVRSIMSSLSVVLMTELPLDVVGPAIRGAVQRLDAAVPVADLGTLDQAFADNVSTERFMTTLLGLFAVVALIISAVGVYGVMAFSVAQQTREIGIRLALGAGPGSVLRSVLRRGVTLAGIGAALGLAGATLAAPVLESMVHEVSVRDSLVFVASPVLLLGVAIVASLVPAWRAAGVHPMETLRTD